jgi:hypothetical protein
MTVANVNAKEMNPIKVLAKEIGANADCDEIATPILKLYAVENSFGLATEGHCSCRFHSRVGEFFAECLEETRTALRRLALK